MYDRYFFSPIYIFFFATILDSCFHSSSFLVSVFKRILYRSLYRAECWPAVTRTTVFVTGTIDSPLDHLEPLPPQKSEKLISFSQSIYFILRDFLNNRFKIVATSFIFCFYFVFSFFFLIVMSVQNVEKIGQNILRDKNYENDISFTKLYELYIYIYCIIQ